VNLVTDESMISNELFAAKSGFDLFPHSNRTRLRLRRMAKVTGSKLSTLESATSINSWHPGASPAIVAHQITVRCSHSRIMNFAMRLCRHKFGPQRENERLTPLSQCSSLKND
jgi:hypothetical protein